MEENLNNQENINYVEIIKKLKENSVSKEEYDKLLSENKEMINNFINDNDHDEETQEVKIDKDLCRKIMNNENSSNLEFCKAALDLRKAIIDEGGNDPFLPYGNKITPTNEDAECAERVAQVMQECIDYANGDSQLFTNELQRKTVDTKIQK